MTSRACSKNDTAWEALFAKHAILPTVQREGRCVLTAEQIREFREPRLMVKFDHRINLPRLFSENRLAILPVTRGSYCILPCNPFHLLPTVEQAVTSLSLPSHIQSIRPGEITSEAVALNAALAAGIFSDFLGCGPVWPTVSGRMSSGVFDFHIQDTRQGQPVSVAVNNAQIEIDAALETPEHLVLVEAKCDLASDFLVRQLYYPFRTWKTRVSKQARTLFLVYSNSIFDLYEFAFSDPGQYDSIECRTHKRYSLEDVDITLADVEWLLRYAVCKPEPAVPFPQADSFPRLLNLCELLQNNSLTRDVVTAEYAFDVRQTNYYADAGRYLGLIEKVSAGRGVLYSLTEKGSCILSLPYKQRQLALCRCLFEHQIFADSFRECLESGNAPSRHRIIEIMKSSSLYNIESESTYYRRSLTISSWLGWVLALFGMTLLRRS